MSELANTLKEDVKTTPLMEQYFRMKSKHPDAILLFRVGDFYETFGKDAIKTSEALGIVLTKRNNGGSDIELAGFPFHSLDLYLPKLVRSGYRVAICEQLEKPDKTKKIVKRGITDIVSPGVTIDDSLLDHKSNNYLAAIHFTTRSFAGIAFLDISTGEFLVCEGDLQQIEKLLDSYQPSEVLVSKSFQNSFKDYYGDRFYHFGLEEWIFAADYGKEKLMEKFQVQNLKGFGIEDMSLAHIAAGAILQYLSTTDKDKLSHINQIIRIHTDQYVWLDRFTIKNLELVRSNHETGKSLLEVLDMTSSPMGARMLRNWILMPLLSYEKINSRLDIVNFMLEQEELAAVLDTQIHHIGDLERVISKISMEKISPRECRQLSRSLDAISQIKKCIENCSEEILRLAADQLHPCHGLYELINNAIDDDAPASLNKGNVFKTGYNEELDEYKYLIKNNKEILLEIQMKEIENTGISNLKIGYNNVFGYYLEVTNKYKDHDKIPESWIRKQTLSNAERYITEELKVLEDKILHAEEKIAELEARLYQDLLHKMQSYIKLLQENARVVAELDCMLSFSKTARRYNYSRPLVDDSLILDIKQGRHPVIEQQLPLDTAYIPNDLTLSNEECQIAMITGPNMSGKSAVLRQTALISLMAQMGSFVPAKSARIGIIDKIFTRVGASDNISSGESTFMLEMNETASIMNNISERSLILLDEIGRGTSTYDGISIAWSLAEFLHNNGKANPKTLFATHYHELNELAEANPRIRNFNVATREVGNKVVFLRKLEEGGCEHSFGVHVAAMAGMPKMIIDRAFDILKELEKKSIVGENSDSGKQHSHKKNIPSSAPIQLSIFESIDPRLSELKRELEYLDLNTMTPIECMLKLKELRSLAVD